MTRKRIEPFGEGRYASALASRCPRAVNQLATCRSTRFVAWSLIFVCTRGISSSVNPIQDQFDSFQEVQGGLTHLHSGPVPHCNVPGTQPAGRPLRRDPRTEHVTDRRTHFNPERLGEAVVEALQVVPNLLQSTF